MGGQTDGHAVGECVDGQMVRKESESLPSDSQILLGGFSFVCFFCASGCHTPNHFDKP